MTLKLTDLSWRRALDKVEAIRSRNDGELPPAERRMVAFSLSITDRHLRRLLDKQDEHEVKTGLSDEQLAYLAAFGTVSEAYNALCRDGLFDRSISTFRRRLEGVGRDLYLGIVYGEEAMRDSYVYLRWEAEHPNDVWQQDSAWAHVAVLLDGQEVQPVIEIITDDRSRLIIGIGLRAWAPDGQLAATTVAKAVQGQLTPDGCPAKPTIIRHDQGGYYLGGQYPDGLAKAWIINKAVRGRAPFLKGKVERTIRTMRVEFLNRLPGSFRVPKALGEDEAKLRHDPRDRLLTWEEFEAQLLAWARWFNEKRPHGALGGRLPAAVYLDEVSPSEVSADGIAALLWRPTETRKVSKNGIHWGNRDFTHPALNGLADEHTEVHVAPDPRDPDALLVYLGREWLCTALPHSYWKAHMDEFFKARGHVEKQARGIRALGSELRSRDVPSVEERLAEAQDKMLRANNGDEDEEASA